MEFNQSFCQTQHMGGRRHSSSPAVSVGYLHQSQAGKGKSGPALLWYRFLFTTSKSFIKVYTTGGTPANNSDL
jgi:hypothetical protein